VLLLNLSFWFWLTLTAVIPEATKQTAVLAGGQHDHQE
jgi:hypothetical protein